MLTRRRFSKGRLPEPALRSLTKNASDEEPYPPDIPSRRPSLLQAFRLFQVSPPPNQALHVFCRNGSCGPRPRMPVFSQEHSFAERVINQNLGPNETPDRTLTVTERTQAPLSGEMRGGSRGSRCLPQRGGQPQPPLLPFVSPGRLSPSHPAPFLLSFLQNP